MRGPISEAIIIVALGFFIGGIAGAIIHFPLDSSTAFVPHPASGPAQGGAPDHPKKCRPAASRRPGLVEEQELRDALTTHESQNNDDDTLVGFLLPMT